MRENMGVFRGKRIDNGEWVEGSYKPEKVGKYLTAAFISEPITRGVWANHRVDPETVSECSGVPDRNGKMMFEGDTVKMIYKSKLEHLATVAFKEGSFGLTWMYGCEKFAAFTGICNVEYEIIDNDELLL